MLLGKIIERLRDKNFETCFDLYVRKPADMQGSGFFPANIERQDVALGYSRSLDTGADRMVPNSTRLFARGNPAGGSYATARDLHSFALALLDDVLLPGEVLTELLRPRNYAAGDVPYGAGFETHARGDGWSWFGHSGGFTGVSTGLRIYPERDYVAIVLCNRDGGAGPLLNRIDQLLP